MVIKRSFQFSIFRVAIIAGIAQAVPEIKGTTLFPLSPNFRRTRSIRKTTRLMYPVSSNMDINTNKIAICGIKITTPPKPGMIPSAMSLGTNQEGRLDFAHSLIDTKALSMTSIG